MRKSYDAIVIGAGIAGLSVARALAKLKQRVLLLEQEREGGNASRAAAGILDPYTEIGQETPIFRLGLASLNFYPSFLEEMGRSVAQEVEYEKRGIIYLALNPEDESFLKDRLDWQKRQGLPAQFLSREEIRREEPVVSPRTQSGVYYPEIPKLNANKLTSALFKANRAAGVELQTSVKKVSLWTERERVRGVKLAESPVESPVVVSSQGAWSGIDETLGIKIEVRPVRGQILLLRAKPGRAPQRMLHTVRYAYLIPWPDERLLVGSTLEFSGFDNRVTPEGKEDILNRASEIMEEIRELPLERSWAGLRPFAEAGRPLIGPTRIQGLFLATGYYRSGILIGPLVGKLLAEGITSRKFSPLLEPFYPT